MKHVWLFWVNDSVKGVFETEMAASQHMVDFMRQEMEQWDASLRPITLKRWSSDKYARIEIEEREVKS